MDLVTCQRGMEVTAPDPALIGHIDPHWLWAQATQFEGYLRKGDNRVRAVVELSSDEATNKCQREEFRKRATGANPSIELSALHRRRLGVPGCAHFVARLASADIDAGKYSTICQRIKPVFVGAGETIANPPATEKPLPLTDMDMAAQIEIGNVQHVQDRIAASLRFAPLQFLQLTEASASNAVSALGWPPGTGMRELSGDMVLELASPGDTASAPSEPTPPTPPTLATVVVGVIDFGCPFAHAHFANDGPAGEPGSRVHYFWDQGRMPDWRAPAGAHDSANKLWATPDDFDYGREAVADRLAALMARWLGEASPVYAKPLQRHDALFEQACYACAGLPELLATASHGAHVLDIAAGRGFTPCGREPLNDDAAAKAPIVFVQLPGPAVSDLSGGWLDAYVIDAAHYIIDRARKIDADARVVINLSFGSYAGPHDGSSLLERALDDIATSQGVAVVLAAGNTPSSDKPIHAFGQLASGARASVCWHIPSHDVTQSFLELWADGQGGARPTLAVTLTSPDRQELRVEGIGVSAQAPAAGWRTDVSTAMVAVCPQSSGASATMALMAVGPTRFADRDTSTAQPAAAGVWTITVENKGAAVADIHLWAERDEPGRGPRRAAAQSHLSAPLDGVIQPSMSHTLTAQACGEHTIVVGGAVLDVPAWHVYGESASGPSRNDRRKGPDLLAPAARMVGQPANPATVFQRRGIVAAANLSAGEFEMQGTSMAAPWVARKVAAIMASNSPTLRSSVRAAIGALSRQRGPEPAPDDPRSGIGALMPDGSLIAGAP
jgi:subtilisin family serine protease